jgi:hypothetical protein
MIRLGSRVEHVLSRKRGTVTSKPRGLLGRGYVAYVMYDGQTVAKPVSLRFLIEREPRG